MIHPECSALLLHTILLAESVDPIHLKMLYYDFRLQLLLSRAIFEMYNP